MAMPGVNDLLVLVDIQNDFCPGGALAVPDGDAVVPLANDLARRFHAAGGGVVLTQDWHPPGHSSFAGSHPGMAPFQSIRLSYGEQTLWPAHCMQGTDGAAFHPDLDVPMAALVLRKGFRPASTAIPPFSRMIVGHRRVLPAIAGNAVSRACSLRDWPRIFVSPIRRRMRRGKGLPRCCCRGLAGPST